MIENTCRLSRSLVVGQQIDGRSRYDPQAKRELVEACLQPGVSVARIALEHGINATLLRKWVQQYRQQAGLATPSPLLAPSAFAQMLTLAAPNSADTSLSVTLPNGVRLAFDKFRLDDRMRESKPL